MEFILGLGLLAAVIIFIVLLVAGFALSVLFLHISASIVLSIKPSIVQTCIAIVLMFLLGAILFLILGFVIAIPLAFIGCTFLAKIIAFIASVALQVTIIKNVFDISEWSEAGIVYGIYFAISLVFSLLCSGAGWFLGGC